MTGAGSGIGRATAALLAAEGWTVFAAGRRLPLLEALASESGAVPIQCDVTVAGARAALVEAAFGDSAPGDRLALVNAAGSAVFAPLAEMSSADVQGQLEANLLGPAALCQAVLPAMKRAGAGRIVNVLSIAARHAFPGAAAYGAAKAGLLQFGKSLALEVRAEGIQVSAVLPGATDTPLWGGSAFVPDRADMLTAEAVAEAIRDILTMPKDRVVDELVLMPPKGIL